MKRIFLITLSLLSAWACTRMAVPAPGGFQAVMEEMEPDTRSNVSDAGHFVWNDWDQVGVYTSADRFSYFNLASGAGTNKAYFVGSLAEDETIQDLAVYPSYGHVREGSTLNVLYPDTYNYPADTTDSCPVMIAKLAGGTADFKHIGGLMRIRYKNVPVNATHLVLTFPNQVVSGSFPVNLDDEEPTAVMRSGSSQVCINFTPPTEPANTRHFYLPLPCGTLTDMTLEFRDADDAFIPGTQFISHSDKTVTRKRLLKMPGLVLTVINAGIE